MATERIAQEKSRGLATIAALNKERSPLIQRRIEIENQINRDRQEQKQLEIELAKTVINAPTDGIILQLNVRNAGQTVSTKDAIAQIAPSNATLVVKARIDTQDRGKVDIGQTVKMRFTAYPYPDYGILEGKVKAIAPDAIAPQNNNSSTVNPYYEVTILMEKNHFVKNSHPYPIQPGMEVTAEIITKEETVLTFMLRKARLLTDL